ncbi:MAG: T9SS type A sorting domain-containing protein [Bacteroidales bacterium]|nr:T9SS type A sorting domain-containing protein [Bacteroidales bacterium]
MKKIILFIIIIAGIRLNPIAQEVVSGLFENPVIRAEYERLQSGPGIRNNSEEEASVHLPFFDDFSQTWIYPDNSRWMDEEVYVNSNFGYRSVNVGVATLDAISGKGKLHANASQFPFQADSLTSRPIRLDSIFNPVPRNTTLADSIYLSFFYQPQGRANPPEGPDSLILQFGYFTGDSVFTNTYDSIWVPLSDYIHLGDTIFPGDTVYSPFGLCGNGLFVIAGDYYFYEDMIQLPCDSIFSPEFKWKRVWSSSGMTLAEFYQEYGTYSRQVMIPILDSVKYFRKDFQFRFINIASLASDFNASWRSNCDQWNVDYVYLNMGRSYKDTVYRDVTFAERAPSLLKNYESMPFSQYVNNPTNEMKENLDLLITNLDSTIFNSTYYYVVYQVDGPFQYLYPGGNCNLFPFNLNGYQNCISCAAHACPPVNFIFPTLSSTDSAEFEVRHYIIGDITPTDTVGDTLTFRQKFFNYYAYDDGTPEEGYGLTPAGSKLAYRFKLNMKDTLRAVQMFFNHTLNDANADFFNIMVWQDENGKPGNVLYSQLNEKVEFSSGLLGFHTYMLDEPLPVNGTFYIGWEQQTGNNLNLGFDRYNNAQQNIFYNSTGQWFQSTYQGALLMRPVLGKAFQVSGLDEPTYDAGSIIPYPNPLNGSRINFRCTGKYENTTETGNFSVSIHSLPGEELFSGSFRQSIDIPRFSPGLYIISVRDENGQIISVSKLIKN